MTPEWGCLTGSHQKLVCTWLPWLRLAGSPDISVLQLLFYFSAYDMRDAVLTEYLPEKKG